MPLLWHSSQNSTQDPGNASLVNQHLPHRHRRVEADTQRVEGSGGAGCPYPGRHSRCRPTAGGESAPRTCCTCAPQAVPLRAHCLRTLPPPPPALLVSPRRALPPLRRSSMPPPCCGSASSSCVWCGALCLRVTALSTHLTTHRPHARRCDEGSCSSVTADGASGRLHKCRLVQVRPPSGPAELRAQSSGSKSQPAAEVDMAVGRRSRRRRGERDIFI
jgi:hypothetical protein